MKWAHIKRRVLTLGICSITAFTSMPQFVLAQEIPVQVKSQVAVWDVQAIYVEADRVSYEGTIFEAKWWTTNEKPDVTNERGV